MNWLSIITTILSCMGFGGIVSGVILRKLDKFRKETDEKEKQRQKTECLILMFMRSVGELARANAIAIKNGKCNGETEAALKEYEKCRKELENQLIEISANK